VPGADSTGYAIGGTTGLRKFEPDPTVASAAAYSYPLWSENFIGSGPAIVDSSGTGDFWTWQDAINAMHNVGLTAIKAISQQIFKDPITEIYTGMRIDAANSLITNENDITKPAINITTGDSLILENIRAKTTTGAAGGNQHAVVIGSGSIGGIMRNALIIDSDNDGISAPTATYWTYDNVHVLDSDGNPLDSGPYAKIIGGYYSGAATSLLTGVSQTLVSPTFSGAASSLTLAATSDSSRVSLGKITGDIAVISGNTKSIISNNSILGNIIDNGTGTIDDNNAQ